METKSKPALLLLPNLLGDMAHHEIYLPSSVDKAVATIDGLIAESEKAGRRFLSRFKLHKQVNEIPIAVFDEHTKEDDIDFFLEPIRKGERWGIVSDAGLPCIADPGSKLVRRARNSGIVVQAFVGPSSILIGLMLSGLPGQNFSFHGYLNREPAKRKRQINELVKAAQKDRATQIFMETPYRNHFLLEALLETLPEEMYLCVAWDLTTPGQGVVSQQVKLWKKSPLPQLEKKNAIFLISID